ncbi:hypothetical protein Acr_23g0003850 [Actinidia rufa]|uniref:Uncharacterized protein n=1 Tax=Actinidia rufa TaxID=165716 RepID=A0A7J0GMI6_9ERIC|nr:hypothetical protein Acr_23g0003850 [Actinidia rufa]
MVIIWISIPPYNKTKPPLSQRRPQTRSSFLNLMYLSNVSKLHIKITSRVLSQHKSLSLSLSLSVMEKRSFTRNLSGETKGPISLQKKLVESRLPARPEPDLTDFMNDMFFGAVKVEKKEYNLTGGFVDDFGDDSFEDSVRSHSGRSTQQWLEEAKRMVASSPSRSSGGGSGCDSPTRLAGSPRFAASTQVRASASLLDRRDPLSRSARRHRASDRFSGEILTKSAQHSRNNSANFDHPPPPPTTDVSPASAVQKWFSNILKQPNPTTPPPPKPTTPTDPNPPAPPLPRKSRFQNTAPQGIPAPHSKRTFKNPAVAAADTLSPPKNLVQSAQRRSISSATCALPENKVLSPLRTAHRKSVSASACSIEKGGSWMPAVNGLPEEVADGGEVRVLNGYLKEQREKIGKIFSGESDGKAKIVLSGPSNSTSSMVAAICYAWLLENRIRMKKEGVEGGEGEAAAAVVPVMNMRRGKMWKQRQVAWLFHHVGLDATALLFSDEVDLETLMMNKQLSILVVGQDILKTNGEVGSQCTILTDNYCEDAYDLLQTPVLKKLMRFGGDSIAIRGIFPNHRNTLYDQLMEDQRESSFFEAMRHNYGKPPSEGDRDNGAPMEQRVQERKSNQEAMTQNSDKNSSGGKSAKTNRESPKSAKPKPKPVPAQSPTAALAQPADASRGKNKFFLAKWFGFASK